MVELVAMVAVVARVQEAVALARRVVAGAVVAVLEEEVLAVEGMAVAAAARAEVATVRVVAATVVAEERVAVWEVAMAVERWAPAAVEGRGKATVGLAAVEGREAPWWWRLQNENVWGPERVARQRRQQN